MSFADIETGKAPVPRNSALSSSSSPQSQEESAFLALQSSLSIQVFKINSNVQGILKLVDQLGTSKDSATLRKSLHDLTETTRAASKRSGEELKKLASLQSSLPQHKISFDKIAHDLRMSLAAFQRAQQVSVEKQRTVVEGVKLAVDDNTSLGEQERTPQLQQAQLLQQQLSPHELAYQESLIQERQAEIQEIETGMHELHQIFTELGTLVVNQGEMLNNIESNIDRVADDTQGAATELTTASEYQRKAGRRAACLGLILIIVVAVVLLAVLG